MDSRDLLSSNFLGWAPGDLRPSWSPLLLIVPRTTCTWDGKGQSVTSAVCLPARALWPASRCPKRGMEGRQDGFALGFGLPHCMLGPNSFPCPPTPSPLPQLGPLQVSG